MQRRRSARDVGLRQHEPAKNEAAHGDTGYETSASVESGLNSVSGDLSGASIKEKFAALGFVTASDAALPLLQHAAKAAAVSDVTVLLEGETGTGKRVLAQAIHYLDEKRRSYPFVTAHCSTINEGLAESEFFGHHRGAFTGALKERCGLFQTANRGTLLLDDVNDLPLSIQPSFSMSSSGECCVPSAPIANPLVVQFQAAIGILVYTATIVDGQVQSQGYVEIEDNFIKDFALDANSSVGRGGIVAYGFQSARIAGNQLINIGPALSAVNSSTAIMIAETIPFDRLDISGNDVRRSDSPTVGDLTSSWRSIFVVGPQSSLQIAGGNLAASSGILKQKIVALSDKQSVSVSQFGIVSIGDNVGLQSVAVRGNHLDASGAAPNVQITVAGPCIFTENQCSLNTDSANPAAFLEAPSVVAGNNVLTAPKTALDINANFFTILGNITIGSITVNGAGLPQGSPWIPLNTTV